MEPSNFLIAFKQTLLAQFTKRLVSAGTRFEELILDANTRNLAGVTLAVFDKAALSCRFRSMKPAASEESFFQLLQVITDVSINKPTHFVHAWDRAKGIPLRLMPVQNHGSLEQIIQHWVSLELIRQRLSRIDSANFSVDRSLLRERARILDNFINAGSAPPASLHKVSMPQKMAGQLLVAAIDQAYEHYEDALVAIFPRLDHLLQEAKHDERPLISHILAQSQIRRPTLLEHAIDPSADVTSIQRLHGVINLLEAILAGKPYTVKNHRLIESPWRHKAMSIKEIISTIESRQRTCHS